MFRNGCLLAGAVRFRGTEMVLPCNHIPDEAWQREWWEAGEKKKRNYEFETAL